ncbi:Phage protein [Kosakonia radicincitans]|nr:Phage protein [Kosakonia radicincitans]
MSNNDYLSVKPGSLCATDLEVVKRMFETWCHCRGLNVV